MLHDTSYLDHLKAARNESKFNMIFESIMKDLNIYSAYKSAKHIKNSELRLIMEEIERPQYIVCESSGDTILLEDAIFMEESYLITEGILDKVTEKIKELISWIVSGVKKVLEEALEVIKAFCEKVKNNGVVASIRKKLGLDEKLDASKFKSAFKFTKGNEEIAAESIAAKTYDTHIISEATTLSKAEKAMTTPKQIQDRIELFEKAVAGKKTIKNARTGKPLTVRYCKDKIRVLKKRLAELQGQTEPITTNQTKQTKQTKSSATAQVQTNQTKQDITNNNNAENILGNISINMSEIKSVTINVYNNVTTEKALNSTSAETASAIGGDEIPSELKDENTDPVKNKKDNKNKKSSAEFQTSTYERSNESNEDVELTQEQEQKQDKKEDKKKKPGVFSKINSKIKNGFKAVGNSISSGLQTIKHWFSLLNPIAKVLIAGVTLILAILAIISCVQVIIIPLVTSIMSGSILGIGLGIFQIIVAGKFFKASWKQGQKAWTTGSGWCKAFSLVVLTLISCLSLGGAVLGQIIQTATKPDKENSNSNKGTKDKPFSFFKRKTSVV